MTSYFSDPRETGSKSPSRPPIWVNSTRRERPDLRRFGRACLHCTRAWGAPFVHGGAVRLAAFSDRVEQGQWRVNAARLGRASWLVPGVERVADALHAAARLVAAGAGTFAPPPPLEGLAIRPWAGAPGAIRIATEAGPSAQAPMPPAAEAVPAEGSRTPPRAPTPRPKPAAAPNAAAPNAAAPGAAASGTQGSEADTLEVIRSLMRGEARPIRPQRAPLEAAMRPPVARPTLPRSPRGVRALPPLQPVEASPPGLLFRAASQALGTLLLIVLLPIGTVKAGWALLRGQDMPTEG